MNLSNSFDKKMLLFLNAPYQIVRSAAGLILRKDALQPSLFGGEAQEVPLTPKAKRQQALKEKWAEQYSLFDTGAYSKPKAVKPKAVKPKAPKISAPKPLTPKAPSVGGPKVGDIKVDAQGRSWEFADTKRWRLKKEKPEPEVTPARPAVLPTEGSDKGDRPSPEPSPLAPQPVEGMGDRPSPEPSTKTVRDKWKDLNQHLSGVDVKGLAPALNQLAQDVNEGKSEHVIDDLLRQEPEAAAQFLVRGQKARQKIESAVNRDQKRNDLLAVDATAIASGKDQMVGQAEKNVGKLIERLGLSEALFSADDFHVRLTNEPYQPLVIEKHGDEIYFTHYYEQNGDQVMDGEMVYKLHDNGQLKLSETAVQHPRGGESRRRNGGDRTFAGIFAKNILAQGFDKPDSVTGQNAEAVAFEPKKLQPKQAEPEPVEDKVVNFGFKSFINDTAEESFGYASQGREFQGKITRDSKGYSASLPTIRAIAEKAMDDLIDGAANDPNPINYDTETELAIQFLGSTANLPKPQEGDRRTINGVTYELRGGRWHRVDDDQPMDSDGVGDGISSPTQAETDLSQISDDELAQRMFEAAEKHDRTKDPADYATWNRLNEENLKRAGERIRASVNARMGEPVEDNSVPLTNFKDKDSEGDRPSPSPTQAEAEPMEETGDRPSPEPSPEYDPISTGGAPLGERVDYNAVRGQKTRKDINNQARELLERGGPYSDDEKEVLAKYSGRGGIQDENSLNEYYTRKDVAAFATNQIYAAGFQGGAVLEPSCGAGVFLQELGDRPDALAVGCEIDPTSSQVAAELNPHAHVHSGRFEGFLLDNPNTSFEAVVGNVPFGTRMMPKPSDFPPGTPDEVIEKEVAAASYRLKEWKDNGDLFCAESLDRLKPGGVMSLIVPHGIVSGANHQKLREYLAKKGRVMGSYRLTNDAFKHTGTSVITDVLVIQKHPDEVLNAIARGDQAVIDAVSHPEFVQGKYYEQHPEMILGEYKETGNERNPWTIEGDTASGMASAPALNPDVTYEGISLSKLNPKAKVGDRRTIDGREYVLEGDPPRWHLIQAEPDVLVSTDPSVYGVDSVEAAEARLDDPGARVKIHPDHLDAYINLAGDRLSPTEQNVMRDAARAVQAAKSGPEAEKVARAVLLAGHLKALQTQGGDTEEYEQTLAMLQAYRDEYGNPAGDRVIKGLSLQHPNLLSLLGAFKENGEISDAFSEPKSRKGREQVYDAAGQAVGEAFRSKGARAVSLSEVGEFFNSESSEADISAQILADPTVGYSGGQYLPMEHLLQGDGFQLMENFKAEADAYPVDSPEHRKLHQQIAEVRSRLQLRSLEDMDLNLWAVGDWIPVEAFNAYLEDRDMGLQIKRLDDGTFAPIGSYSDTKLNSGILRTLKDERIRGNETASYNYPLKQALKDTMTDFKEWVAASDYRFEIEDAYNQAFNAELPQIHSGDRLDIPGFDEYDGDPERGIRQKRKHDYQNSTIRQMADVGRGMISLGVGLGKTATAIGLVKHLEDLGRADKAAFTVPKSVLANWVKEFKFWAPGTEIHIIGMTQQYWADGSEAYEVPGLQVAMEGEVPVKLKGGEPLMKLKGHMVEMVGKGKNRTYKTDKDGNYLIYSEDDADLPAAERNIPISKEEFERRAVPVFQSGSNTPQKDEAGNYILYADEDRGRSNPIKMSEAELRKKGVLAMSTDDAQTRQEKLARYAQASKGIVLMSEPVYQQIGLSPRKNLEYLEDIVGNHLNSETKDTEDMLAGVRARAMAQESHEERKARENAEYAQLKAEEKKRAELQGRTFDQQKNIYWEDLGINALFSDEAHHYKNLFSPYREGQNIAFLSTAKSKRSLDHYMKSRHVRETNNNQGTFMLTATPTTNNPLEAFNMLQHICPDELEKRGIRNVDAFLSHFGQVEAVQTIGVDLEPVVKEGLVGFKNLKDLRQLFNKYTRMESAEDLKDKGNTSFYQPEKNEHDHYVAMTEAQQGVYNTLRERAKEMMERQKDPNYERQEGDDHIFSVISDMDKAAIDINYYDNKRSEHAAPPEFKTDADRRSPKIDKAVENVMSSLKANGGKQLMFCDAVEMHEELKKALVQAGYPEDQIQIVNATTAKTASSRTKISQAFNGGKKTLVIGNTATMGEGMNFNIGTTDIHHLTTPWTPAAIEQRNGRGVRQGNELDAVNIHHYHAKGSFDSYRRETNNRKAGWINELWKGDADTARNENTGLNGEDLLFLFADDPEAARKQLQANKEYQAQKMKEEGTKRAAKQFSMLQAHKALYNKMGEVERESDKGRSLKNQIEQATRSLQGSEHFAHKGLLDNPHPIYVDEKSGQHLAVGQHVKNNKDGAVYRIDFVDLARKKITTTQVGGSDYSPDFLVNEGKPIEMKFDRFSPDPDKAYGFSTTDYSPDLHEARVVGSSASYGKLFKLDPAVVDKHRDTILANLRDKYEQVVYSTPEGIKAGYAKDAPADAQIFLPHDGGAIDAIAKYLGESEMKGSRDSKVERALKEMVTGSSYTPLPEEVEGKIKAHKQSLMDASPQDGYVRTNSAGNREVFRGGRWHRVDDMLNAALSDNGAMALSGDDLNKVMNHIHQMIDTYGDRGLRYASASVLRQAGVPNAAMVLENLKARVAGEEVTDEHRTVAVEPKLSNEFDNFDPNTLQISTVSQALQDNGVKMDERFQFKLMEKLIADSGKIEPQDSIQDFLQTAGFLEVIPKIPDEQKRAIANAIVKGSEPVASPQEKERAIAPTESPARSSANTLPGENDLTTGMKNRLKTYESVMRLLRSEELDEQNRRLAFANMFNRLKTGIRQESKVGKLTGRDAYRMLVEDDELREKVEGRVYDELMAEVRSPAPTVTPPTSPAPKPAPQGAHPDPQGAIYEAIIHLNENSADGGRLRNDDGFTGFDMQKGKMLAAKIQSGEGLTPSEERDALRIIKKHRNTQLTHIQIPTDDELARVHGRQPGVKLEFDQTVHAKKGIDLYVAKIPSRISRDEFTRLKEAAKEYGGYYSAYDKRGAIPGFQFEDEESAREFIDLHGQDLQKTAGQRLRIGAAVYCWQVDNLGKPVLGRFDDYACL